MFVFGITLSLLAIIEISSAKIEGGWDTDPNVQYHVQTDEGPERYFRYQTISGQYRKEKRLPDGTVIGSYGWVDPDGYLRLRDYIADDKGYRIVKTKKVLVGKDTSIGSAVAHAKYVPSQGGVGVENAALKPQPQAEPQPQPTPIVTAPYKPYLDDSRVLQFPSTPNNYNEPSSTPISLSDFLTGKDTPQSTSNAISLADYLKYQKQPSEPQVVITPNSYSKPNDLGSHSESNYIEPVTFRPYFNPKNYNDYATYQNLVGNSLYDGVSMTHNGFRYYLPRQYHEEESSSSGHSRAGSFGYIDPFGIRRVIYYNTNPGSGFKIRKNNRYVGFNATPYDPRF